MYGIFTYIWSIFMVNVGKYASPMEHMGIYIYISLFWGVSTFTLKRLKMKLIHLFFVMFIGDNTVDG